MLEKLEQRLSNNDNLRCWKKAKQTPLHKLVDKKVCGQILVSRGALQLELTRISAIKRWLLQRNKFLHVSHIFGDLKDLTPLTVQDLFMRPINQQDSVGPTGIASTQLCILDIPSMFRSKSLSLATFCSIPIKATSQQFTTSPFMRVTE